MYTKVYVNRLSTKKSTSLLRIDLLIGNQLDSREDVWRIVLYNLIFSVSSLSLS